MADELSNPQHDQPTATDAQTPRRSSTSSHEWDGSERRRAGDGQILHAIAELETQLSVLKQRQAEAQEIEVSLDQQRADLAAYEAEIQQRSKDLVTQTEQLAAQRQQIEQAQASFDDQQAQLDAKQAEIEQARSQLEARQLELDAAKQSLAIESAQAKEQAALQSADAQAKLDELATRENELSARQQELDNAHAQLEHREQRVEQKSQQLRDYVAQEREAIEQREAALKQRSSEIEQALLDADENRAAHSDAQAKLDALQQEHQSTQASLTQAQSRIAQLESDLSEARAAADSATASDEQTSARIAQLESDLDASRTRLSEATDKLVKIQSRAQEAIKEREAAITELGQRLERAERQSAAADTELAARAQLRHQRLARMKKLLTDRFDKQWKKIEAAKETVARKNTECDQILRQRSKLASTIIEINKLEKKLNATTARKAGTAMMLYFALTLAILAGLSWAIVQQVAPGTYIASATVTAETRGITPDDERIKSWQTFHEDLVTDPRVISEAADRMGRRGIAALANPAELNAVVASNLYTQSAQPGTLTIEYRSDQGPDRARLVLDTYVTAMVAMANAGRGSRSDGIAATITQPATAASAPLGHDHLIYAAGLLAGSLTAAFVLGLVVWSRVSRSKKNFEKNLALEEAMASVNLGDDDEDRHHIG